MRNMHGIRKFYIIAGAILLICLTGLFFFRWSGRGPIGILLLCFWIVELLTAAILLLRAERRLKEQEKLYLDAQYRQNNE
ncbi:hypothetical protein CE91St41_29900 [Oscillospiraceae bacterium]|nr:hypothetical protein CE91St40_29900 [Oscillospiraceae bacterium]BDF76101.1 hypothetical protein CE91St41_29900 [Oscillospiraceae bacterium]